jgi:hypothetical protein
MYMYVTAPMYICTFWTMDLKVRHLGANLSKIRLKNSHTVAWPSGNVSACGITGREIEYLKEV